MILKTLKEKIGLLYNKVSSRKESAVEYVRRKCDDIPPQKRFRVVAVRSEEHTSELQSP